MNYRSKLPYQNQLLKDYYKYLEYSESEKLDYVSARRRLLLSEDGTIKRRTIKSAGTRSVPKVFTWGPYMNEVYRFTLDIVMNHSTRQRTVINLAASKFDEPTNVLYHADTDPTHFMDYALYVALGSTKINPDLAPYFRNDIIVDPNVLRIVHNQCGLLDIVGKNATFYFTGSILNQDTIDLVAGRWRYYDWMRSWDGGATFYTCLYGKKHWLNFLADTYVTTDGRLISTDLYNSSQLHIDYDNGDILEKSDRMGRCVCGLEIIDLKFQDRGRSLVATAPNGQTYSYAALRAAIFEINDEYMIRDAFFDVEGDHLSVIILGTGIRHKLETKYSLIMDKIYGFKSITYKDYIDEGRKMHLIRVR